MPIAANMEKKSYFERLSLHHIHDNVALKNEYSFTELLKIAGPRQTILVNRILHCRDYPHFYHEF